MYSLTSILRLVYHPQLRKTYRTFKCNRHFDGVIPPVWCQNHNKFSQLTTNIYNLPCIGVYPDRKCLKNGSQYYFSTSNNEDKKPSLYQRFKLMYKEYWYVLLPVHVVTSSFWLGGFYYMAVSGIDIAAILELLSAPDTWVTTMRESKAGGIVTAYTMYKIATPARYTVTLGGTTVSINYLKKWGLIKPMPTREKLKSMYEERKTAFKDKVSSTTDEIKDEFSKTRQEITQHMKEAKSGFAQSVTETREGFKEGVRDAADEWKHVGKLVKQNVQEMIKTPKKEGNK